MKRIRPSAKSAVLLTKMKFLLLFVKLPGTIFLLVGLTFILLSSHSSDLHQSFLKFSLSWLFWYPLALLYFVGVIEALLKLSGALQKFSFWLEQRFPKALSLVLLTSVLGILPAIGGALFSCALVKNIGKGTSAKDLQLAEINFWFRHFHVFINPLIPGVVLTAALTEVSIFQLMLVLAPMGLLSFLTGWLWFISPIDFKSTFSWQPLRLSKTFYLSSFFILLGGLLSLLFFKNSLIFFLFWCACLTAVLSLKLLGFRRVVGTFIPTRKLLKILWDVSGVLIFAFLLREGGLNDLILSWTRTSVLPMLFILSLGIFFMGIVTGVCHAYVALLMPIAALFYSHDPLIIGFLLGVGLSSQFVTPSHLCLIVTSEYFDVSVKKLIAGCIPPLTAAFVGWSAILAVIYEIWR